MNKIKVKTVYEPTYMKEPNVSEYDSTEEADMFVRCCLKWGIGIVSCEIIEPNLQKSNNTNK